MINPTSQCCGHLSRRCFFVVCHLRWRWTSITNGTHTKWAFLTLALTCRMDYSISFGTIISHSISSSVQEFFDLYLYTCTCVFCTPGCTLLDFIGRGAARFEEVLLHPWLAHVWWCNRGADNDSLPKGNPLTQTARSQKNPRRKGDNRYILLLRIDFTRNNG